MKIIHCADLHLDSRMETHLSKERAKERKAELLHNVERLVTYAVNEDVRAILLAGDVFDGRRVSAAARNTLLGAMADHPEITFFYLKGNHDDDSFLTGLQETPKNLKLFSSDWTTYVLQEGEERVTISGVEISSENAGSIGNPLVLSSRDINIVMLHGEIRQGAGQSKNSAAIDLWSLRNKGIDYLALGHIHQYQRDRLDSRGIWCYSGCLEGRGMDECGEHGFVLLQINEYTHDVRDTFIPFAQRNIRRVMVDVTGLENSQAVICKVQDQIRQYASVSERDLVRLVLTGEVDVEAEMDPVYIRAALEPDFFFLKVYDETRVKMDPAAYAGDRSLKGEFIRKVMADGSLQEADKAEIIRYGLRALAGEEVE
ncbi:MAG: metallophosphoesterase [Lachnospiraceae bacterium]|nr:metallophosphoesterase [Lachnospiraceae bacterium]